MKRKTVADNTFSAITINVLSWTGIKTMTNILLLS